MAYYLAFDGVDDHIVFASTQTFSSGNDFAAVFDINYTGTDDQPLTADPSTFNNRAVIETSTRIVVRYGSSNRAYNLTVTLPTGRQTLKIKRNGFVSGIYNSSNTLISNTVTAGGNFSIVGFGKDSTSNIFDGDLYDIKTYSDFGETTLVNHWNPTLSGGTGTTLTDSENANNGTLTNFSGVANSWWVSYGASAIAVTATLGTITYTSQNTTVDIGGSIDVAATLGTIAYASQNTVVGITGSVDVTATLGAIEYASFNTTVSVTGDINVNATLGLITYASQSPTVSIGGVISVSATLGAIQYDSKNANIQISGVVQVNATLGTITYSSKNAAVNLSGLIDINATLGLISYNSNNTAVNIGSGQIIGVVSVGFADDIYNASFKPNQITVTFKG